MKKYSALLMFAAVAAATLVSCEKEMNQPMESNGIQVTITTGDVVNADETKTFLEGTTPYWYDGDKLLVVQAEQGSGTGFTENSIADGAHALKATFSGIIGSEGEYYAIYPWTDNARSLPYYAFPQEQTIPSKGSMDPKADVLISKVFSVESSTTTIENLRFARMTAFLKVTAVNNTGVDLSNETVKKVTVTSSNQILIDAIDIDVANTDIICSGNEESNSVTALDGTYKVGDGYTVLGILPVTFGAGETITVTVETENYKLSKTTAPLTNPIEIKAGDLFPISVTMEAANMETKVLTVERIVKKLPIGPGQPWTAEYGYPFQGYDRSAATDGQYAYVVSANNDGRKGILRIDLADPTNTKQLDVSTVSQGCIQTAALNTIYDPSTGKYILLVCSLSEWNEAGDGYHFKVYAYKNGTDEAPECILDFVDSQGRHLGEIFSVVGDWSNGEIWVRNRTSPSTLCWPLKNGVPKSPLGGGIGYDGSKGLGVIYKYELGSNQVLLENENLGLRYNLTVSDYIQSFSGVLWSDTAHDQSVMGRKYGVTPFEFNGKKYIAYTQVGKYETPNNAARARLKIIEDQGSAELFGPSIEADKILFEFPIQNGNDNATTAADFDEVLYLADPSFIPDGRILASCSVAKTDDAVIILSHCYNVGLSVFKMYMK